MTIAQVYKKDYLVAPDGPVRLFCKQPGHSGNQPIFLVHGDRANELLPSLLPSHIPFFAFHHMHFEDRETRRMTIEQLAVHYVAAMKTVQPEGPYFLSGYSLGGMIAFEMARQLKDHGDVVRNLILIDSRSPTMDGPKDYHNRQIRWTESRLTRLCRKMYKKTVIALCLLLDVQIPDSHRPFYIMEHYRRGRRSYRPGVYRGDAVLIRSTIDNFPDHLLGWQAFFDGNIEVLEMDTDHHRLTKEPMIRKVADVFRNAYGPDREGRDTD